MSAYFHGQKSILPNFSSLRGVATSVSFPEVRIKKETEIGLDSDKVTDSKIEDNMRLYLKARYEPPFKSILDAKIGF